MITNIPRAGIGSKTSKLSSFKKSHTSRVAGMRWAGVLMVVFLLMVEGTAYSAGGYQSKIVATPTPTINRSKERQRELEAVYEGYARLYVLGHILTRTVGLEGYLPITIDLDFFTRQPLLAGGKDIFVYRPSSRGDVMWPLILPTLERSTPTSEPTITPTPVPVDQQSNPTETPTPTATLTPTEVVPPVFKLQAIGISQNGSYAMVDNIMLTNGDVISEATITEISRSFVTIEYFGKTFYVTKKGTFKPEDYQPGDLLED